MIDRSYLPFQSAREYQDTGMQKWMGFFLSEHTSSLDDDSNKITYLSSLTLEDKVLLISQLYANQLTTRITVTQNNTLRYYIGTLPTINSRNLLIKTSEGHFDIDLDDIISIELVEEVLYESA